MSIRAHSMFINSYPWVPPCACAVHTHLFLHTCPPVHTAHTRVHTRLYTHDTHVRSAVTPQTSLLRLPAVQTISSCGSCHRALFAYFLLPFAHTVASSNMSPHTYIKFYMWAPAAFLPRALCTYPVNVWMFVLCTLMYIHMCLPSVDICTLLCTLILCVFVSCFCVVCVCV